MAFFIAPALIEHFSLLETGPKHIVNRLGHQFKCRNSCGLLFLKFQSICVFAKYRAITCFILSTVCLSHDFMKLSIKFKFDIVTVQTDIVVICAVLCVITSVAVWLFGSISLKSNWHKGRPKTISNIASLSANGEPTVQCKQEEQVTGLGNGNTERGDPTM
jgi:hypothetical protein